MLLPMLGLINIYFMRYSLVADHWQYAASLGPIALFAAAISRAKRPLQWLLSAVVLLLLVLLSDRQAFVYRSGESLWRNTIVKNPESWMPRMNLGHTLAGESRYGEAKECYRAAELLAPDLAEPYYSLATIYAQQGRYADAVPEYEQAVRINPRVVVMFMDMGHSLAMLNQFDRALACFQQAIDLRPDDANQRYQTGLLLEQMHRFPEAAEEYRRALQIEPNLLAARAGLERTGHR
jgi:tetratricopeptide (TPR) repeat protein